jgi:adenosylmethionine-8-amino-7-oxononanoate aminotransferase
LERILREHHRTIAAVVIEPVVQGAAGMIVQPAGFLGQVRRLASEYDVLLVCDEVATGFGRTGRLFACEHEAVSPDLMCLAKGITGGYMPLAATLATDEVFEAFLGDHADQKHVFHGHTYTGNALACAAALASLRLFGEGLLESLPAKAERLARGVARLDGHAHVVEVRQRGLMLGIELSSEPAADRAYDPRLRMGHRVVLEARARGVLLRPLGDVVVLMPPLAASDEELDLLARVACEAIDAATAAPEARG